MLHLTGYDLTLDDLRGFRQWGSQTPGPPRGRPHRRRRGHHRPARPGLRQRRRAWRSPSASCAPASAPTSSTTARSASWATATSRRASATRRRRSPATSASAASCASTTTTTSPSTAPTELALSDDAAARFRAYGWHVEDLGEAAEDLDALEAALQRADGRGGPPVAADPAQPHRLPVAAKTDDPATHGYALNDDEIREAKAVMGLPDEAFYVPDDVLELYRAAGERGPARPRGVGEAARRLRRRPRASSTPRLAASGLPGWERRPADAGTPGEKVATRVASGKVLQALADVVPGARRRRRRPHRQHRHRAEGPRRPIRRRARRPADLLRRPRARHGRGDERHGAARRRPPGRRHVPRVQRLLPAVGAPGRAVAGQGHLLVHPRLGRASARTAPPTSRSSTSPRCGPSPACA